MLRAGDLSAESCCTVKAFHLRIFSQQLRVSIQSHVYCGQKKSPRFDTIPENARWLFLYFDECESKMEQLMNSYLINGRRKRLCVPFVSRAWAFCAENLPPHMRESDFRVTTKRKPSTAKHTDDSRLLLSLLFLPIEGQRPCFYLFIFFHPSTLALLLLLAQRLCTKRSMCKIHNFSSFSIPKAVWRSVLSIVLSDGGAIGNLRRAIDNECSAVNVM